MPEPTHISDLIPDALRDLEQKKRKQEKQEKEPEKEVANE